MAELVIEDNEYLMRKIARNSQNFKERKFNEDRRTYKDVHTSGTILIIMSSLFLTIFDDFDDLCRTKSRSGKLSSVAVFQTLSKNSTLKKHF